MKKYLITGAAGFIGANIINALLIQSDVEIHALVHPDDNLWRIHHLTDVITVHHADLLHFDKIKELVVALKPTHIFHLASYGGTPDQTKVKEIYDVNFYGTVNLLQACKTVGFSCFINTGSSSEYGKKNDPMKEDDVLEPISDYAIAKASATHYCLKTALVDHLPVYTIRPFSVYGNYEMNGRLMTTLMINIILKKPIHLANPKNKRDFIYVSDVVDAYIKLSDLIPRDEFIFNIGSGKEHSIEQVVNTIQKLINKPIKNIVWGSSQSREWEPEHWIACIERAKKLLSWSPHYSLYNGLHKSLEWFDNNIELYDKRSRDGVCL